MRRLGVGKPKPLSPAASRSPSAMSVTSSSGGPGNTFGVSTNPGGVESLETLEGRPPRKKRAREREIREGGGVPDDEEARKL